jgi:type I restriction enzyme S subunit
MWKTVKLGDICKIVNGSTPSRKEKTFWEDGDISWFTIDDMREQGRDIFATAQHVTQRAVEEKKVKLVPANSVLLCCTASIGEAAIARKEMATNQQFNSLTPLTNDLSCEYLYYVATTLKDKLLRVSGSTTISFVSMGKLKEIEIPLPPLAEQQRIVAKLDAAFAEIDRAIEIAIEKQQQSEQLADTALDEIATLEGESVTLAQVCSIEAALVSPIENPYRHQKHIGAGNIISFSNQLVDVMTAEEEKLTSGKYPFNESSVLYSKIRPYLRKVHLPESEGICSADMYPLVPNKEKLTREFLFYLLLSNHFTNYAITGSARAGMPKVNRNHLFAYQFSLPNVTTQKAFSQKMEKILTQTRNLNAFYQSQIDKLAALKSAILAQELQPPQSEAA